MARTTALRPPWSYDWPTPRCSAGSGRWREVVCTPDRAEAAEPGGGPIIATKLHIPELPADRVSRPSLVAELRDGSRARLILVSAPAGAGKTTVLASWRADPAEQRPFAWLSLDPQRPSVHAAN